MAKLGETPTNNKVIHITVREEDFDVKCDSIFTKEELYIVFVSLLQHLEDSGSDFTVHPIPSMLQ